MASESKVALSSVHRVTHGNTVSVEVCLNAFHIDTIKETCYRFSGKYYNSISVTADNQKAIVKFQFPTTILDDEQEKILQSFNDDLLDQDLRNTVSKKTEAVRNLILANAFANSEFIE